MSGQTTERRFTYRDKATWGPGMWQDEPDKLQWVDTATGLDCLIVRGPSGALCGYVGVPEGHPFFGVGYSDCPKGEACEAGEETWNCNHKPDSLVEVHGGLTFSDFCQEGAEERGICHIPFDGRPDRVWWLGFDCAHSRDVCPAYAEYDAFRYDATYKTEAYVRHQVAKLAAQLAPAPNTPD